MVFETKVTSCFSLSGISPLSCYIGAVSRDICPVSLDTGPISHGTGPISCDTVPIPLRPKQEVTQT